MEEQLENLKSASEWFCVAAKNVVLYLEGSEAEDELLHIRELALDNARMEVELRNSHEALERVRENLARLPDLDIDREYHKVLAEVNKERPSDRAVLMSMEQCVKLEDEISRAKEDRERGSEREKDEE